MQKLAKYSSKGLILNRTNTSLKYYKFRFQTRLRVIAHELLLNLVESEELLYKSESDPSSLKFYELIATEIIIFNNVIRFSHHYKKLERIYSK